jgi:hypothetical protein
MRNVDMVKQSNDNQARSSARVAAFCEVVAIALVAYKAIQDLVNARMAENGFLDALGPVLALVGLVICLLACDGYRFGPICLFVIYCVICLSALAVPVRGFRRQNVSNLRVERPVKPVVTLRVPDAEVTAFSRD